MLSYIKKYPISLFIILTVIYLSFFKPPKTDLNEIPNLDKLVHICMYFGMSGMLWLEFLRAHRRDNTPMWHAGLGAFLCPVLFSGSVELMQEYCTTYRGGDWLDFAANSTGAILASLVAYYGEKYDVWGVTHKDLDLTDEAAVFKTVENYRPDVLLHCAAVSDVAECSKKPELSHAVNVLGTEYLAKACGKTGTKLVMCSSDQVYFRKRGEQESLDAYLEPHWEDCIETPEPLYGKQKLQGEELCLKYQPESVVLRLSWMYDSLTENELAKGRRNLATMLREMLDQNQSRKFSDTDHRGVTDVTLVVKNMEAAWKLPGGIYNYGSSNDANMYETVRRVMASFGQEALAEKATGGNVRNLMMSTDKLARHGIFFPDTAAGLEAFLRKGGAL